MVDYKIKPFSIVLPKTRAYVKSYNGETKWMYFLIEDEKLLKTFNDFWNKDSNSIKKTLIANPSTMKKFSKSNKISW